MNVATLLQEAADHGLCGEVVLQLADQGARAKPVLEALVADDDLIMRVNDAHHRIVGYTTRVVDALLEGE